MARLPASVFILWVARHHAAGCPDVASIDSSWRSEERLYYDWSATALRLI